MSKVKIFLDENETLDEVEENLVKAFTHQVSGDVHEGDKFDDPAIQDACVMAEQAHKIIYQQMLEEIYEELNKDYLK